MRKCIMSKILISIKPEYVEKILSGIKKYEYRKVKCQKGIKSMIIYETSPIKKVVAEVEILDILEGAPEGLWEFTKDSSGTSKEFFEKYFENRDIAYAFKLGKIDIFECPKDLKDYGIDYAPQSFIYIE